MQRTAFWIIVFTVVAGLGCTGVAAQEVLVTRPPAPPPPPAAGAAALDEFKTADELLDALETADRDLRSLVSQIKYDRVFQFQGEPQQRLGEIYYVVEPPGPGNPGAAARRKFAIRFSSLWTGKSKRTIDQTYAFDGEWLLEKDGIERIFTKRQVVPPGERFDPLRIGEGPFVIPIGQRKADILARYDVEMRPTLDGLDVPDDASGEDRERIQEARGDVQGSWQIRLTPRAEFRESSDFAEIRLWYRRVPSGELLPRMARTVNTAGDVSTVLLINTELQQSGRGENPKARVPTGVVDTAPPAGWDGEIKPYRMEVRGGGAGGSGGGGETP